MDELNFMCIADCFCVVPAAYSMSRSYPSQARRRCCSTVSTPSALWRGCNIEISGALFPLPTWSRSDFGGKGAVWWLTRLLGSGRRWWPWSSCRCWTPGGSWQCCIYMCHVHLGTRAWWVFAPLAAGHVVIKAGEGCSGCPGCWSSLDLPHSYGSTQSLGLCETVHKDSSKHEFNTPSGLTTSF